MGLWKRSDVRACSEPVGLRDGAGALESKERGSWSRQKGWHRLKDSPVLAHTSVGSLSCFVHLPKMLHPPLLCSRHCPSLGKKCREKVQFIKLWGSQKNGRILQVRKVLPGKTWRVVGASSRREGGMRVSEDETQKGQGLTLERGCPGMAGMARSVSSVKFQRRKEAGFCKT